MSKDLNKNKRYIVTYDDGKEKIFSTENDTNAYKHAFIFLKNELIKKIKKTHKYAKNIKLVEYIDYKNNQIQIYKSDDDFLINIKKFNNIFENDKYKININKYKNKIIYTLKKNKITNTYDKIPYIKISDLINIIEKNSLKNILSEKLAQMIQYYLEKNDNNEPIYRKLISKTYDFKNDIVINKFDYDFQNKLCLGYYINLQEYVNVSVMYYFLTTLTDKDNRPVCKIGFTKNIIGRYQSFAYATFSDVYILGIRRIYKIKDEHDKHEYFKNKYPELVCPKDEYKHILMSSLVKNPPKYNALINSPLFKYHPLYYEDHKKILKSELYYHDIKLLEDFLSIKEPAKQPNKSDILITEINKLNEKMNEMENKLN